MVCNWLRLGMVSTSLLTLFPFLIHVAPLMLGRGSSAASSSALSSATNFSAFCRFCRSSSGSSALYFLSGRSSRLYFSTVGPAVVTPRGQNDWQRLLPQRQRHVHLAVQLLVDHTLLERQQPIA